MKLLIKTSAYNNALQSITSDSITIDIDGVDYTHCSIDNQSSFDNQSSTLDPDVWISGIVVLPKEVVEKNN